ncbi:MAG: roadblock/LC7 domain-containing protein [Candidatus Helarchaeota archaeon]|nr:roadblock/LC7 domain-containing protein [Candidatus Helarchaeota archaeon]
MAGAHEIESKITNILQRVAMEVNLYTLALITREGRRIAYYSTAQVDPDLMSAVTAAILNAAEMAVTQMSQGELWEIVVRGSQGFSIVSCAGTSFLLVGAGTHSADLGRVVSVLRDYAKMIAQILGI